MIAQGHATNGARAGVPVAAGSLDLHGCGSSGQPLPVREVTGAELSVRCWFLGAHGGAGESTLTLLFAGFGSADHAWPVGPPGCARTRVVLCARTSFWGMAAAMRVAGQWEAERLRARVEMPLGLVLVADRPGRLPKQLEAFAHHLGSAAANTWRLPWVDAWAAGEVPCAANSPMEAYALRVGLSAALAARKAGHGWSREC